MIDDHNEKTEKGVCRWCAKEGLVSFTPMEHNFHDSKINEFIEDINDMMMNNKLIKITEDIFACKQCVEAYNLKPLR